MYQALPFSYVKKASRKITGGSMFNLVNLVNLAYYLSK